MPIFIITGTPGSGKSSIAAALMRRFAFGLHIPIDDLRELVVSGIAHPVPEWTDETGRQFALARRAAAHMARLYAEAGFAVAIDDVIFPAEVSALRSEALDGFPVYQVLLYPSLDVALERSATRTNKDFDAAVLDATIRDLHRAIGEQPFEQYGWLVIDSGGQTVEETVDAILRRTAEPGLAAPSVDKRGVLDEEVFSYRASKD